MRPDSERILLVHAYPTDEVAQTGGTIAALIASGVGVTVLTCTRGELAAVAADAAQVLPGDPRGIGELREREARIALSALGVTDHRFLGDPAARRHGLPPRQYLDSGSSLQELADTKSLATIDPASLIAAPMEELLADIHAVVRHVEPTTIIVCDGEGGELRPDHIKVYQAVLQVADFQNIPVYAASPLGGVGRIVELDVFAHLEVKRLALSAHRSQLSLTENGYRTTDGREHVLSDVERFRLVPTSLPEAKPKWPEPGASLWTFLAASAAAFFAGVVVSLITTLNHQAKWDLFGAMVPVGVGLGVATLVLVLAGIRLVTDRRAYAIVAALGVVAVLVWLWLIGIGGYTFVPMNLRGIVWVITVPLTAVLAAVWPSPDQTRALFRRLRGGLAVRVGGIMKASGNKPGRD